MQVGIINEENYPQILRGISQRRRHGVLELHAGEHVFEVYFFQGKIIDVSCDKRTALSQVADRLVTRGSLLAGPWLEGAISPAALLEQSEIAGFDFSGEMLSRVWEQRLLECLYSIELISGSYYNFRVEFIPTPENGGAQISVGQLLLDLVGYGEVHSAFARQCKEESILSRGTPAERDYTFEENDLIWLVDGEITVAELRKRSLLNRLTFEETISSLLQEGILVTAEEKATAVAAPGLFNLDAALDACIDRAGEVSQSKQSPESIVREIWTEKQLTSETPIAPTALARFSFSKLLETLSARVVASEYAPEIVMCVFLICACIAPLAFW